MKTSRFVFATLSAFGLIGLAHDVINWQSSVEAWVDAWVSVSRIIWDHTLWRVFIYFDIYPWDWLKDYLTMGLLTVGMKLRADLSRWNFQPEKKQISRIYGIWTEYYPHTAKAWTLKALRVPDYFILWPRWWFKNFLEIFNIQDGYSKAYWKRSKENRTEKDKERSRNAAKIYFESMIIGLILILINYSLFLL